VGQNWLEKALATQCQALNQRDKRTEPACWHIQRNKRFAKPVLTTMPHVCGGEMYRHEQKTDTEYTTAQQLGCTINGTKLGAAKQITTKKLS